MKDQTEISSVTVAIAHYQAADVVTQKSVVFSVSRRDNHYKAIPSLTKEERRQTGLPEELHFFYYNYCIMDANDMEEETLDAIKQIILELQVQNDFY